MFWSKTRPTVITIVLLAAWLGAFALCDHVLSARPLDDPLSLDPPGSIDKDIWLRLPERYYLELTFSRANSSFEELQKLIGSWNPETDGVPVGIAWSVTTSDGVVAAEGATIASGASGWNSDVVFRSVATVEVPPGQYRFRARILEPAPQLAHLSPHLRLALNFKFTTSWQSAVLWWGMIINMFVGLPVLLGLLASLLFIVVRDLRTGSRGPPSLHSAGR